MRLSLMNNSTADRFPNIWFITKKKNTPTLQKKKKKNKVHWNINKHNLNVAHSVFP